MTQGATTRTVRSPGLLPLRILLPHATGGRYPVPSEWGTVTADGVGAGVRRAILVVMLVLAGCGYVGDSDETTESSAKDPGSIGTSHYFEEPAEVPGHSWFEPAPDKGDSLCSEGSPLLRCARYRAQLRGFSPTPWLEVRHLDGRWCHVPHCRSASGFRLTGGGPAARTVYPGQRQVQDPLNTEDAAQLGETIEPVHDTRELISGQALPAR